MTIQYSTHDSKYGLHGHLEAPIRMAYHVKLFTHTNRKLFFLSTELQTVDYLYVVRLTKKTHKWKRLMMKEEEDWLQVATWALGRTDTIRCPRAKTIKTKRCALTRLCVSHLQRRAYASRGAIIISILSSRPRARVVSLTALASSFCGFSASGRTTYP